MSATPQSLLRAESVRALRFGAFYSMLVIAGGAATIGALDLLSGVPARTIFLLQGFLLVAFLSTAAMHWLCRRAAPPPDGLLKAAVLWLTLLPGLFLLAVELEDPADAAAFYLGPVPWIYFPPLALTGLFFSLRYSTLAGALAGLLQLLNFILIQGPLLELSGGTSEMLRNLNDVGPNLMRGLLLLSTGIVIGLVGRYSRRLVFQIAEEQSERTRITGLFGQFVSDEVRNRILQEKSALEAERRTGAILFTDIRGFTSLSESMDPESLVRQLNRYFAAMVPVIEARGGVIDKFIGDAIMVTFGTVIPAAKPCSSAYRCALEMQNALRECNLDFEREGLPVIRTGIGIHYAEVIQGAIGADTRREYTVMGDGVNVAARLESATRSLKRTILLSEAVWRQLQREQYDGLDAIESLGHARLKGRREPIGLYAPGPGVATPS